ncbi:hypothetical protein RYX36_024580, partial [Vicia faba]
KSPNPSLISHLTPSSSKPISPFHKPYSQSSKLQLQFPHFPFLKEKPYYYHYYPKLKTGVPSLRNAKCGITSRPEESVANSNPSFTDGVATKDIHIDPFTSLSIRIFLPHSALSPPEPHSKPNSKPKQQAPELGSVRRSSYGPPFREEQLRGRNSNAVEGLNLMGAGVETGAGLYRGYSPVLDNRRRKLSVMLQFH